MGHEYNNQALQFTYIGLSNCRTVHAGFVCK